MRRNKLSESILLTYVRKGLNWTIMAELAYYHLETFFKSLNNIYLHAKGLATYSPEKNCSAISELDNG